MAITTRDKRASVIGVLSPLPRLEQNPSGHIRKAGRHMAAFLYSGIQIQVISPVFSGVNGTVRLLTSSPPLPPFQP